VLLAGTAANFSLPSPTMGFTLAPQSSAVFPISFVADTSAPPHQRTGTLRVSSDDPFHPTQDVALSAYINTLCTEAGQYIYTVDNNGTFSRFDPRTLTYLDLGPLNCPTTGTPYSMNVDQNAVAWVLFTDAHIYKVDTTTVACTDSGYVPDQQGFHTFGMGSAFDSATGVDTLFLASETTDPQGSAPLGALDLGSLTVSTRGLMTVGSAELAGTGDGQLWAFSPGSRNATGAPLLARVDPHSGATLEAYDLSAITSIGGFALKFFGGAFYVFVGADIWKVDRASLDPTKPVPTSPPQLVVSSLGRDIVGAGVSTCAPVH
jgi:hypothetical protein